MSLPIEKIALAWKSFTGIQLEESELYNLANKIEGWPDLTAQIILNSDFIIRYPDIDEILRSHAPTITRCILQAPVLAIEKIKSNQVAKNKNTLYELQSEYAKRVSELVELEIKIISLKNIVF